MVGQATCAIDSQYIRIHLQTPGTMGKLVALHSQHKSYSKNIWCEGSPYNTAIENVDKQIDRFIAYLKGSGKWGKIFC